MATNVTPTQSRAVDAYASFSSSTVNFLTRIVTLGEDGLLSTDSMSVSIDGTSTNTIIISPGYAVKDDVLIQFTEDFQVDMSDPAFYTGDIALDSTGYYYIALYYEYAKMKPPPEAKIKILKPDEKYNINLSSLMFLACVEINSSYEIENVYTYDPSDQTIFRNILGGGTSGVNVVWQLPTWDVNYEGFVYYEEKTAKFYAADSYGWNQIELINYVNTSSDYTAKRNDCILVDGEDVTITLENDPTENDNIWIYDVRAYRESAIIVNNNGSRIDGSFDPVSLHTRFNHFFYSGDDPGWLIDRPTPATGQLVEGIILYQTLLQDSDYSNCYYDLFDEPGTVDKSGSIYNSGAETYSGDSGDYIQTQVVSDEGEKSYYFYSHIETDSTADLSLKYSIDGTSWVDCSIYEPIYVEDGFYDLYVRIIWNNTADIYSFGVLYELGGFYSGISSTLYKHFTPGKDYSIGEEVTLPEGMTYKVDGKSLRMQVNYTLWINDVHFTEVDSRTIRLETPLKKGDDVAFWQELGYVDVSEENTNRLDLEHDEDGYHVLKDQDTGQSYKLTIQSGDIVLEPV